MHLTFIISLYLVGLTNSIPTKTGHDELQYTSHVDYSLMELNYIMDKNAKCNDGSIASYYIRRNTDSRLWIVYIAGGMFCQDEKSCIARMRNPYTALMTTSNDLSKYWHGDGLLNDNYHKNPEFWNANHIYVPYCSSDFWLGNITRITSSGQKIHFFGTQIIASLIKDLLKQGLKDSSRLLLVGSSAGGVGVLQNIDRVAKIVRETNPRIDVSGIVDSAWFIGNGISCQSLNEFDCHPHSLFKDAAKFWNGQIHDGCKSRMGKKEHKCLFAHNVIKDLHSPVFIVQWLYDTVQILNDNDDLQFNANLIFQPKYMKYVSELGEKMRHSLRNVNGKHGLFAASCISHTLLTTTNFLENLKLSGTSLNDALQCWLRKQTRSHRNTKEKRKCKQSFIDSCTYVNCNPRCPVIVDPLTGNEISFPVVTNPPTTSYPPEENIDIIKKFLNLQQG